MLFLNSLLKTQLHLDLLIQLWFLDVQLESSITATQYQHNQLTKNKSENIVKMSLSKSDVNGMFQFSKVTLDKSKETMNNNSETFLLNKDIDNFTSESIKNKLEIFR